MVPINFLPRVFSLVRQSHEKLYIHLKGFSFFILFFIHFPSHSDLRTNLFWFCLWIIYDNIFLGLKWFLLTHENHFFSLWVLLFINQFSNMDCLTHFLNIFSQGKLLFRSLQGKRIQFLWQVYFRRSIFIPKCFGLLFKWPYVPTIFATRFRQS